MGDKIVSIVTTTILLLIFMVLVAFISTDSQIDKANRAVKELTEEIQYKGYITMEQYNAALLKIPLKSAKLNITHIMLDEFSRYTNGTLDMVFTTQILERMQANDGIYSGLSDKPIKVGDQIQIDLVITERTFFDVLISIVAGGSSPNTRILTSESGVILNTKY